MTYPIFDGHNDVLLKIHGIEKGVDVFLNGHDEWHIDYPRASASGWRGGFFAIWVPNPDVDLDGGSPPGELPDPLELHYAQTKTFAMLANLLRLEAQSSGKFKIVRTVDDLATSIEDGTMAAIAHIEGAGMIDTDLNLLDVLYQAGLRSIGIVWSRPNAFGNGVPFQFNQTPDTGDGLTDAGKQLVRRCNELGIMIDLSHITEKGFWDVESISDAPLVATHSNVHALCPSPRNLTDKQLDAIKASDGMVGLNFAAGFLHPEGKWGSDLPIDVMVQHIDYLVEKLGIDRVGFGSDFDGAQISDEIKDVTGTQKLVNALADAGYDDDALNKITHQNWLRVLRQTWK